MMKYGLSGACASMLLCLAGAQPALASPSVYVTAPDEPRAVTVKGVGDGRADDSAAIQQAIDQAAAAGGGDRECVIAADRHLGDEHASRRVQRPQP